LEWFSDMPKKPTTSAAGSARRRIPTQADIVRASGLSAATVSHALTGRGRLSTATREQVLASARSLGYRPNTAAQAISTGRFGSVALLLGMRLQSSILPQQLVWGIEDALEQRDLYLLVARLDDQRLLSRGYLPKVLRTVHADGMLINYTHWHPPELSEQVARSQVPAVWINTKRAQDCVYPDEFGAGVAITERLVAYGHRRIDYIDFTQPVSPAEPSDVHFSTIDRYAGYAHAMTLAGLTPRRLSGGGEQGAVAWSCQYLRAGSRPTAVIAFNPCSARPVQMAAMACGLEIPRDLSLVVFDEEPNRDFDVSLATIVTPDQMIGRMAVEMLMERLDHTVQGLPSRTAPLSLVDGHSLGPPAVAGRRG
jgi:LacI family transcriptional regulator